MGKSNKWPISAAVFGIIAVAVLAVLLRYNREHFLPGKRDRPQVADPTEQLRKLVDPTLREIQGWTPQDFFKEEQTVRAAAAISARDQTELQALIDGGLDVNVTGKAGFTLLYWAFAEDNFEAFDLLLSSGADPDQKLTRSITLQANRPLVEGNSIPFTCIRTAWKRSQLDFFFAALEHAREKNPRDFEGNTLLQVLVAERRINEEILARFSETGVDLDMQTQYGGTAAMWAVRLDRPQLALKILQAGADPNIKDKQGQSVASLMLQKLEREKGNPNYPQEDAARLLEWLEKHSGDERSTGEEP